MGLAESLWAARRGGTHVTVNDGDRPDDAAGAYAVQRGVTALAGTQIGWKVGATAQAAMDLLGFKEPFFGPLYERFFHASGEAVPIVPAHNAGIETEFVVGLARDLPPREAPYTDADIEAAVAWVAPGFEIIGTRLSSGLPGAGNLLIADGGANMDFVLGPKMPDWRDLDLTQHQVVLSINDAEAAVGHSGMLLFGHTFGSVTWLANAEHLAPRGLLAGDIITTGSCTGVIPIAVGDRASADFGALGEISVSFIDA